MQKTTQLLTAIILLITFTSNAQYETGTVNLSTTSGLEMSVGINLTASGVTLTLSGPSDRWFALGFGGNSMASTTDVFAFDGTGSFDKIGNNFAAPSTDANQDWTITSNTVSGSQRILIATRSLSTSDGNDFTFSNSAGAIPVIWARGNSASTSFAYHGAGNRGITNLTKSAVAGIKNHNQLQFVMYPNPTNSQLNVVLPSDVKNATVAIYSVLSKQVMLRDLSDSFNNLDVSNLSSGIYLIKITGDNNTYGVKQFIKK